MELVLADLELQEKLNIRGTAAKHGLVESTLQRRWKGETVSMAASLEYKQRLSGPQEEALTHLINSLTDRGLPPTSMTIQNLAEELLRRLVGKNWTGDFIKRYKDWLKSLYLRNIDIQRHKAEYTPSFKQFYDLVV